MASPQQLISEDEVSDWEQEMDIGVLDAAEKLVIKSVEIGKSGFDIVALELSILNLGYKPEINRDVEMRLLSPRSPVKMKQYKTETSSHSQTQIRRSSASVVETSMESSSGERLVIKPVANVATHCTDSMTVLEEPTTDFSSSSEEDSPSTSPTVITGGQFGATNVGPAFSYWSTEAEEPRIVPGQPANVPTEGGKNLTESVIAYPDAPLARWCRVYPGVQKMGFGIERPIAVKIVPYSEKKIREAKNLLRLTPHVNVVSIIAANELRTNFSRTIYIVMEQCQTMTLEQYYKNRKEEKVPYNTKQALEFARQVIDGINHIHARGILHRDMKPSSILFSLDGKFLKIIDFGVSKELKNGLSTISMTSRRIGTDGFRAPETYKIDLVNRSADIFSLGIVLHYIWSDGRHPFGDDITMWTHNIYNYTGLCLENLLVPDKEKAKCLLSRMLKKENHDRLNISGVRHHEYICEGVHKTLMKGMAEVWQGPLQVNHQDEQLKRICCNIYERVDESVLKTGEQTLDLGMKCFPDGGMMKKMSQRVGGMPSGYLAIARAEHYSLLKRLEDNKMGWIDITRQGGSRNAMLIFHPKGYEELYGVYVEKPEGLVSTLHDEYGVEQASTEETSSANAVTETPQQPMPADESLQGAFHVKDAVTISEPASEAGSSLTTDDRLLEYISWWVYKPEEPQQPAASSQQ